MTTFALICSYLYYQAEFVFFILFSRPFLGRGGVRERKKVVLHTCTEQGKNNECKQAILVSGPGRLSNICTWAWFLMQLYFDPVILQCFWPLTSHTWYWDSSSKLWLYSKDPLHLCIFKSSIFHPRPLPPSPFSSPPPLPPPTSQPPIVWSLNIDQWGGKKDQQWSEPSLSITTVSARTRMTWITPPVVALVRVAKLYTCSYRGQTYTLIWGT